MSVRGLIGMACGAAFYFATAVPVGAIFDAHGLLWTAACTVWAVSCTIAGFLAAEILAERRGWSD